MTAVIDKNAYESIKSYIDAAKKGPNTKIVVGGECDDSVGWFITPTIVEVSDPNDTIMSEVNL